MGWHQLLCGLGFHPGRHPCVPFPVEVRQDHHHCGAGFLMITMRKMKWNNDILHLFFHNLLSLTNLSASTRRSCRWKGTSSHFSIAFLLLPWLSRFMFRFCNKSLHLKFYCFWMDIVFPPLPPKISTTNQPWQLSNQPTIYRNSNHLGIKSFQ